MTDDRHLIGHLDDAVNRGDLVEVARLVEQGADVNGRNTLGDTPLITAAYTGQAGMVRWLLAKGADKPLRGFDGKTAQERAAELPHPAVLSVLDE